MFSVLFFPPCSRMVSIKWEAYILTRSPSFSMISGSLFRGEKWHTQLLTDTHVGKAIPGKERESEWGSAESESDWWLMKSPKERASKRKKKIPFFISFSLLKIFPVSAAMKASPFSHRLSTETPALAASTTAFRASAGQEIREPLNWLIWCLNNRGQISVRLKYYFHHNFTCWLTPRSISCLGSQNV